MLLREKKLPMALLEDPESKRAGKAVRASLVQTQPFAQTFGAKQTRKRPRLSAETYSDMLGHAAHHSARCAKPFVLATVLSCCSPCIAKMVEIELEIMCA